MILYQRKFNSPFVKMLSTQRIQPLQGWLQLLHNFRAFRVALQLHAPHIPAQLDFSRQQQNRVKQLG
jgi:hypothetical protein